MKRRRYSYVEIHQFIRYVIRNLPNMSEAEYTNAISKMKEMKAQLSFRVIKGGKEK